MYGSIGGHLLSESPIFRHSSQCTQSCQANVTAHVVPAIGVTGYEFDALDLLNGYIL